MNPSGIDYHDYKKRYGDRVTLHAMGKTLIRDVAEITGVISPNFITLFFDNMLIGEVMGEVNLFVTSPITSPIVKWMQWDAKKNDFLRAPTLPLCSQMRAILCIFAHIRLG